MAEPAPVPSNDDESVKEGGLSARILGLISAAKLEERRKAKAKLAGPKGERRRRNDLSEPK